MAQRVSPYPLRTALLAVFVSGCLGAQPDPGSTPSPTPSDGPDMGPEGPGILKLEGCKGAVGVWQGPLDRTRAEVPKGLRPYGDTPVTADLLFLAFRCERASDGERLIGNVSFFQTFTRVRLNNESWGERGKLNFYTLDTFAHPAAFATLLTGLGISPMEASSFQFELLAGTTEVGEQRWRYASPNATVEFEFSSVLGPGGGFAGTDHFWAGVSKLRRIDRFEDYRTDSASVTAGQLRLVGQTRIGKIMDSDKVSWQGQAYYSNSESWLVNATEYHG